MTDFMESVLTNSIGGLVVAATVGGLAYARARVPKLSGVWTAEISVNKSDYNPYIGMKLTYIFMLSQRGGDITGVAEKVHETSIKNPSGYHYQKNDRAHSEVSGGVSGNVFQRKEFQLLLKEKGHVRNFVSTVSLRKSHDGHFLGNYVSTAANSSGTVSLTKGIGIYGFSANKAPM